MHIKPGSKRDYKAPKWWNYFTKNIVPTWSLSFLDSWIESTPRASEWIKNLPNSCPFDRSYVLVVRSKEILIYFCPPLCYLNPFYDWLIDTKISILNLEKEEPEVMITVSVGEGGEVVLDEEATKLFMDAVMKSGTEDNPVPTKLIQWIKENVADVE